MIEYVDAAPPEVEPEPGWGQSLGDGAAGIALRHITLARTGTAGWATVQRWTIAMTRHPITAGPDTGLYRGAPAVAYVLHTAGQPAYTSALDRLDTHITALTRQRLGQAHTRIDHGRLPALREFDLISGLTGIGAYLMHRYGGGQLLHDVLAYLVRLTQPLHHHGTAVPGWWTADGTRGRPSPHWPGGHSNQGLAHGVAGPLALLSTAARHGITVAGHRQAITRICDWLDRWQNGTGSRPWWPGTVSLAEHRDREIRQPGPQRPSWCYGTPGLARAQQVAGLALADPDRQRHAEHSLAACLTDDRQLDQLRDASLCHGWAGLLHTTRRAAADATTPDLAAHLPRLHTRLLDHLDWHGLPDHDGLLEGSTGIRLVLEDFFSTPPDTPWDACLLLPG